MYRIEHKDLIKDQTKMCFFRNDHQIDQAEFQLSMFIIQRRMTIKPAIARKYIFGRNTSKIVPGTRKVKAKLRQTCRCFSLTALYCTCGGDNDKEIRR